MADSVSILDCPEVSGRYLFPQPRAIDSPYWVDTPDGQRLACALHQVDPSWPTIVHFHGNGEVVADYVPAMRRAFAELELNSLFVEYRQYGESSGRAQLVAMLGDGEAAVRQAQLTPRRTIAFGRSIGSLYAIELAGRIPELGGLILESGIADPSERFLAYADFRSPEISEQQVREEAQRFFPHKRRLGAYQGPLLLLHTEHDSLVEISHAERNYKWSASPSKRLVRFADGDHNSILGWNQAEYFAAVRKLADELPDA